jgi:hypothetical protein
MMDSPTSPGVASPCIDVCRMDPTSGWCEGCLRSIDEITAWSRLPDDGKRAVWRLIDARRAALAQAAAPGAPTHRPLP